MLITCQNCATSYQLEPSALGATGRSVRCVRCGQIWFAANTDAMSSIAEEHHAAMAAFAATLDGEGSAEPSADETPPEPSPLPEPGWNVAEPAAQAAEADVLPPEPVMIADAPALVPTDTAEPALPDATAPGKDSETIAPRRAKPGPRRLSAWSLPGLGT